MAELLTGTWLARLIEQVRRYTDEPSVNAKYSTNDIIAKISEAWNEIWIELNNNNESPIVVRYDIALVTTALEYQLPASVGQIIRFAKINAETDLPEFEFDTRAYWNPTGFGMRKEGPTLRLGRYPTQNVTLRLEYVPGGDIKPMTGQWAVADASVFTANTCIFETVPVLGVLDTRPNAYAGHILRTTPKSGTVPASAGEKITQERVIESYNAVTRTATLSTDFSPTFTTPSSGWDADHTVDYEVIPMHYAMLESVLTVRVAQNLLAGEGHAKRMGTLQTEYMRKIRSMRLALLHQLGRRASQFEGDITENFRYGRRRRFF